MNVIQKVFAILSPSETKDFKKVLLLFVGLSFFEMVGLASIMPFLGVLGNPNIIEKNSFLADLFYITTALNIAVNTNQFIFILGFLSLIFIAFAALFRGFSQYYNNRFMEDLRHKISKRILEIYLNQPYSFFMKRHSSELTKNILSDIDHSVERVIRPILTLISNIVILISLVGLLVVINPLLIILSVLLLGGLYSIIYLFLHNHIKKFGDTIVESNKQRYLTASDAFGGIKTIKVWNTEAASLSAFEIGSHQFSRSHAGHQTLGIIPSYIVEVVVFGAIIILTLALIKLEGGLHGTALGNVLPTIGIYALCLIRMKPVAQSIYQGIAAIRFGDAIISNLYNETRLEIPMSKKNKTAQVPFYSNIELNNIIFTYPDKTIPSLHNFSVLIPKNSSLGIIGHTGSGKSTVADILLMLLYPANGHLLVDGRILDRQSASTWRKNIGYVPQEVFLNDTSIAENIAFGLPKHEIDYERVKKCAQIACIDDFITNEMESGYETRVGERGIILSGGQRQRLGIARAFYKNPEILIFDEATSALDTATEKMVLKSIFNFSHQKTIIIISHRTALLNVCDNLIVLKGGKIIKAGKYTQLLQSGTISDDKIK